MKYLSLIFALLVCGCAESEHNGRLILYFPADIVNKLDDGSLSCTACVPVAQSTQVPSGKVVWVLNDKHIVKESLQGVHASIMGPTEIERVGSEYKWECNPVLYTVQTSPSDEKALMGVTIMYGESK